VLDYRCNGLLIVSENAAMHRKTTVSEGKATDLCGEEMSDARQTQVGGGEGGEQEGGDEAGT